MIRIQRQPLEPLLADYLDESRPSTQVQAYWILLSLGSYARPAVPVFLREMEATNAAARTRASQALNHVGLDAPETIPVLCRAIADEHPWVRYAVIFALHARGAAAWGCAPTVAGRLEDPDANCRFAALTFLGGAPSPEEFRPYESAIRALTSDPNPVVRQTAERVLREQSDRP